MTTLLSGHDRLVTLEQWQALPEESDHIYELVEGVVRVVPRPMVRHQLITGALTALLNAKLPPHLVALAEVEVVIDDQDPATVRVPDVVVTHSAILDVNPARLMASDVLLAVEVHSPGTRRTDRVLKVAEYAQAGIPSYWLVDSGPVDSGPVITVLALHGDHYEEVVTTAGTLSVDHPAALLFDVPELTGRRV